jgi:hypothetical protein
MATPRAGVFNRREMVGKSHLFQTGKADPPRSYGTPKVGKEVGKLLGLSKNI